VQLLVSVRSAAEVEPALSGGADIIDAKEPSNGSLGPVSRAVLTQIMQALPETVPFSIALGDFTSRTELAQAVAGIPLRPGGARCYVKLGFAGVSSPDRVRALLEQGCKWACRHETPLDVVAVAYADADLTGSLDPEQLCGVAVESRVRGVLIDTQVKSSGNLLTRMSLDKLAQLVATLQKAGLLAAVAGSLEAGHLAPLAGIRPDIVGVRRAACTGGREGIISSIRVRQLRRRVLGETPDAPANLAPGVELTY
jgi:uncharacterized protein (UPF0264 family)